jgi:NAD(P) transhydrogenase subunit alpha
MIIGVPTETFADERRVALVPLALAALAKRKHGVVVQAGAGAKAGYPDADYNEHGAEILPGRREVFEKADIVVQVRGLGANPDAGLSDLELMRENQVVIAMLDPLGNPAAAEALAERGVTAFAMELLPRITRAQSMDVLSSMATIAGYKAALIAATSLPKMFPMMMTAAGSITPAKVFVIGVGVAGLQAIATAKRLGAVVEAYDIRPEVKDQVKSVGGKFVELELDTDEAGDTGGYARAQSEAFYARQQALMTKHVADADVVITTAAVPGKRAPILVTAAMVEAMKPGAMVVDLAADTGGNCELTDPGKTVDAGGVSIIGPTNVPSSVPFHASQMYAKNVATFLEHLTDQEGELSFDLEDEITRDTLVAKDGEVVHERVAKALASVKESV